MIKVLLYSFILLIAVLLEATLMQLPLALVALIVFSVLERRAWILLLGVFAGLLLDSLTFRLLGTSSIFFLVVLGLLFLYKKKYETYHIGFASVFLFVACLVYELIFGLPSIFLATLLATFIGIVILLLIQYLASNRHQK